MYWLIVLMSLSLFALVATGIYLEFRPVGRPERARRWFRGALSGNLLTFFGSMVGLVLLGLQDVMAAQEAAAAAGGSEVSVGLGLALIGIGIPTGLAAIGAGIGVGPVGAASLAVITEKPEMLGRTLIYLGLAEGVAIYGLVVTILLLAKI
jgi:V/A-type H+-transporting ATPase subunit K